MPLAETTEEDGSGFTGGDDSACPSLRLPTVFYAASETVSGGSRGKPRERVVLVLEDLSETHHSGEVLFLLVSVHPHEFASEGG